MHLCRAGVLAGLIFLQQLFATYVNMWGWDVWGNLGLVDRACAAHITVGLMPAMHLKGLRLPLDHVTKGTKCLSASHAPVQRGRTDCPRRR